MPASALIPAAQYLRMSTEHQQYSLKNQAAAIQEYARDHGFAVVHTYENSGRSGLLLKRRVGLQRLLADVVKGKPDYAAILVYDVSRWGRFQDADEAAHYEFLCKQAGIPVHYCAEPFTNDSTVSSSILKALKRSMAAEFSRELGVKVYAGKKRLVQLGFRVGGRAGYGLRRMMVSAEGKPKQELKDGEYKSLTTDRVILVPGPKKEVDQVRQIFQMALRKRPGQIMRDLNARGVPFLNGRRWTYEGVSRMLKNPKYTGCNVWGRTAQKLRAKQRLTPSDQWAMQPGAFRPIVSPQVFNQVRAADRSRRTPISDQSLLQRLRRLLAAKGSLTERMMKRARGMSSVSTYIRHFGSIRRVFELVGYPLTHRQRMCSAHFSRTRRLQETLQAQIENLFPNQVQRCFLGKRRPGLRLDDGLAVAIVVARHYKTAATKEVRWQLRPKPADHDMVTLLCLSNTPYDAPEHLYIMRGMNVTTEYQIKGETDRWLQRGQQLRTLADFYTAAHIAAHDHRSPKNIDIAPTMKLRRKLG